MRKMGQNSGAVVQLASICVTLHQLNESHMKHSYVIMKTDWGLQRSRLHRQIFIRAYACSDDAWWAAMNEISRLNSLGENAFYWLKYE